MVGRELGQQFGVEGICTYIKRRGLRSEHLKKLLNIIVKMAYKLIHLHFFKLVK